MVKRWSAVTKRREVSPEAIRAWQTGDWLGVYKTLQIRPWWPHPLDIREGDTPPDDDTGWAEAFPEMLELRRHMIELAGEPPVNESTD